MGALPGSGYAGHKSTGWRITYSNFCHKPVVVTAGGRATDECFVASPYKPAHHATGG